jgi:copper(I)-binding protein
MTGNRTRLRETGRAFPWVCGICRLEHTLSRGTRPRSIRIKPTEPIVLLSPPRAYQALAWSNVWARPTAGSATTAAVYFTVTNKSQPDRLTGVSTPIAAAAELHETINDNGVMKMRPVQSIALDPGKPVTFKPGGYHVMLTGVKGALKAGDSFPLTLTFEHAQPITETVKVDAAGGAAAMGAHGGMEGMPGMQGH